MSEAMERPTSVEVGQRFRGSHSGKVFEITAVHGDGRFTSVYEDGKASYGSSTDGNEFLGYAPGHGPPQPQVAAGQRRRWLDGTGEFTLEDHPNFPGEFQRRRDDGKCGGVNFSVSEVEKGSVLLPTAPAAPASPPPPPPPRYNIAAGAELRYSNGHPRTALEAIQARKKPEPWRPSVDDFDLLPDVDVRRCR